MLLDVRALSTLLVTAALAVPAAAKAQAVVLDEGRFSLFVDGTQVGTESFAIRRSGAGDDAEILATGVIQTTRDGGRLEMRTILDAHTTLAPDRYNNKISGARQMEVSGFVAGARFVSRSVAESGETQKEFRAGPGTALLEDRVAHHYYFLSGSVSEGTVIPIIVPSTGAQARLRVVSVAHEPFRLGREQLQARHVRLEGDGTLHEVWFDDQNRVLRVEIPSLDFRAERDPS